MFAETGRNSDNHSVFSYSLKKVENRVLEILLVEDNTGDIRLVQEYFKAREMVRHNLNIVTDGVEAMKYLYNFDDYKNAPFPDIILLDLNLPKKDGWQVLREIREDRRLKDIPVCVLTPNEAESEILELYSVLTQYCIAKPVNATKFINLIKAIK